MQRTDTRIVEPGRYRVWFDHLTIFRLHQECFASMKNTWFAECQCCCGFTRVDSLTGCFHTNEIHMFAIEEMIKCTGRVASTANASDHVIRERIARCFRELLFHLCTDHRLESCNHVGIRMWPDNRPDDVMRVGRIVDP